MKSPLKALVVAVLALFAAGCAQNPSPFVTVVDGHFVRDVVSYCAIHSDCLRDAGFCLRVHFFINRFSAKQKIIVLDTGQIFA